MPRVLEVVIKARSEMKRGLSTAQAEFDAWRKRESQHKQLLEKLAGPAAVAFGANAAKRVGNVMHEMAEAVGRGEKSYGGLVDEVFRSIPIFGSAYSATRDFVSVFSGEAVNNARALAKAEGDLVRAASQKKVAEQNKTNLEQLREMTRAANNRAAVERESNDLRKRMLESAQKEAAAIREIEKLRKEGLQRNAASTVVRPQYPATLSQGGADFVAEEKAKYQAAMKVYDDVLIWEQQKEVNRERISKAADDAITAKQKEAAAERLSIQRDFLTQYGDIWKQIARAAKETQDRYRAETYLRTVSEMNRAYNARDLAKEIATERADQLIKNNGRYIPTVGGVLAGQQFSGLGAIAQAQSQIDASRAAAEAKQQRTKMIEKLENVVKSINSFEDMMRVFGGSVQFGTP